MINRNQPLPPELYPIVGILQAVLFWCNLLIDLYIISLFHSSPVLISVYLVILIITALITKRYVPLLLSIGVVFLSVVFLFSWPLLVSCLRLILIILIRSVRNIRNGRLDWLTRTLIILLCFNSPMCVSYIQQSFLSQYAFAPKRAPNRKETAVNKQRSEINSDNSCFYKSLYDMLGEPAEHQWLSQVMYTKLAKKVDFGGRSLYGYSLPDMIVIAQDLMYRIKTPITFTMISVEPVNKTLNVVVQVKRSEISFPDDITEFDSPVLVFTPQHLKWMDKLTSVNPGFRGGHVFYCSTLTQFIQHSSEFSFTYHNGEFIPKVVQQLTLFTASRAPPLLKYSEKKLSKPVVLSNKADLLVAAQVVSTVKEPLIELPVRIDPPLAVQPPSLPLVAVLEPDLIYTDCKVLDQIELLKRYPFCANCNSRDHSLHSCKSWKVRLTHTDATELDPVMVAQCQFIVGQQEHHFQELAETEGHLYQVTPHFYPGCFGLKPQVLLDRYAELSNTTGPSESSRLNKYLQSTGKTVEMKGKEKIAQNIPIISSSRSVTINNKGLLYSTVARKDFSMASAKITLNYRPTERRVIRLSEPVESPKITVYHNPNLQKRIIFPTVPYRKTDSDLRDRIVPHSRIQKSETLLATESLMILSDRGMPITQNVIFDIEPRLPTNSLTHRLSSEAEVASTTSPAFSSTIPKFMASEAFGPRTYALLIYGRLAPTFISRLVQPLLVAVRGPNSYVPVRNTINVNLNGTPTVVDISMVPQVRTSVLNSKHHLVGNYNPNQHIFSSICSNWSIPKIIINSSLSLTQKLTYSILRFAVPHWVKIDDRVANRHEYNLIWSTPHQTPFLRLTVGYFLFEAFRIIGCYWRLWNRFWWSQCKMIGDITQDAFVDFYRKYTATIPFDSPASESITSSFVGPNKWMQTFLTFSRFTARTHSRMRDFGIVDQPKAPLRSSWLAKVLLTKRDYAGWQSMRPRPIMNFWLRQVERTTNLPTPFYNLDYWMGRINKQPGFGEIGLLRAKLIAKIPLEPLEIWTIRRHQVSLICRLGWSTVKKSLVRYFRQTRFTVTFFRAVSQHFYKHKYIYVVGLIGLLTALQLSCLRRKMSYYYPFRQSRTVLFYGCGPCNPSHSHILASQSSKRNLHAIPDPLPPSLSSGTVTKRCVVNGAPTNYVAMELVDRSPCFKMHPYTYYWREVGHCTDPVSLAPLHVVEAVQTCGDVSVDCLLQFDTLLMARGLPVPLILNIVPLAPPGAPPEQWYQFNYYDADRALVSQVRVRLLDFGQKLALLVAMVSSQFTLEDKNKPKTHEELLVEASQLEARFSLALSLNAMNIVPPQYAAGEPIVRLYLMEMFLARVSNLTLTHYSRFKLDNFTNVRHWLINDNKIVMDEGREVDDSNYALAFAPKRFSDLILEEIRVSKTKRNSRRYRKKPKGEALHPNSFEEPATVNFTCRACARRPPKKFRWFWQMCPSCYFEMKSDSGSDDPYFDPEQTAPFPEGLHHLGAPTRINPVQPKFKEKPVIPEFIRDFKFGNQRGDGHLPIDRTRGPQAVGVVTNIRSTVYNALGAGQDHFGPGEPGLVRNRIFKAPTYNVTQLAWDTARRNIYHPSSFLMQQLSSWRIENNEERVIPYRFSDPSSTFHAIQENWITVEDAQEIERYLDEFDSFHSTGHEVNCYQDDRGWISTFEPSRQREIWQEARDLVRNGITPRHSKCKLFMKMEKAPNCADYKTRPASNPRCIISFSNVTQLMAGRYTRAVTTLLHHLFSPSVRYSYAGGMNPDTMDSWLAQEVNQDTMTLIRDVKIVMSDYSAFDTTQKKEVLDFWHQFLSHVGVPIYPTTSNLTVEDGGKAFPSSDLFLGWIFKAWSRPIGTTTRRNKLRGPFMNCSGRGDTAAMNFFLNFTTQYLAYLIVLTRHYGPYSDAEYSFVNDNIRFIALGDDSLVFVPTRRMDGTDWDFNDLQVAVSFFGFEFSEGKITDDPRDIIFLGMRPWPALKKSGGKELISVVAWAPVLGRYLQKMGWRMDSSTDPYAWWKGITKAASICFPHLQIVNDISQHSNTILTHHTQSPIWDSEMRQNSYKLYYIPREEILLPDDERASGLLHYLYNIDRGELDNIRSQILSIRTFPVVLSNHFLERAMEREAS